MKKFSVDDDMERVQNLYRFEDDARAKGFNLIAGVDEAIRTNCRIHFNLSRV